MNRTRLLRAMMAACPAVVLLAVFAGMSSAPALATPEFRVPTPVTRTLDNGLRVVVFANPRLPLVQMQLLVPAGVAAEPPEQAGVASLTAQLLRLGTTSRSARQLADEVDGLGGSVAANAARDFAVVSGAFLSRDFEAGLELLSDGVVNPIFPELELELVRGQTLEAIQRAHQNPEALAEEQTWSLAFDGHPYGRSPFGTVESVNRLTRAEVQAFHRDCYRPDRAVLAIAGDVTPERAFAAAAEWFGHWAGKAVTPARAVPPAPPAGMRIRVVDVPGRTESEVRVGLLTGPRSAPDYLALSLANAVLGGGAASRLARTTGAAGGLSHEARSSLTALADAGLLQLGTFVRSDSSAVAIRRLRAEVQQLLAVPPAEAELAPVRRQLEGSFPLSFETLAGLIGQWMAADFYGLPPDYLSAYRARIAGLGTAEVAAAVRRQLDPDRLAVVVVGPAAQLKSLLAPLGPVEVVGSEPAAEATGTAGERETVAATPEQAKRGRALLEQALAAHGGLERLRGILDSSLEGDMTVFTGGRELTGQIRQVRKEPFKMEFGTVFLAFASRQVLDGDRAWAEAETETLQVTEQDSAGVASLRSGFGSDLPHLLLDAARPGLQVAYRGREGVAGHQADVIEWTLDRGVRRRFYLDLADHRVLAMEQTESPDFMTRRIYGDYRPVQGIIYPFLEERFLNGERAMKLMLHTVAINAGVNDSAFKPRTPTPKRRVR